jgi:hypothetical protein
MADWNERFASTRYHFVRVSRSTGKELGLIPIFKGGSITRNLDVRAMETAELSSVSKPDLGRDLVRVYMDVKWDDGTSAQEVLGTFLPSVPKRDIDGDLSTYTVNLTGRLQELLGDSFSPPVVIGKGADAVAQAKAVCEGVGLTVIAEPSIYRTSTVRTYGIGAEQNNSEVGETKLDMVNDLLSLAGYWSAKTDPMGRVVMKSYASPDDRPVSWGFAEGPKAKFESKMTEERDASEVANHVVCRYSSDDVTVIGEAWDKDPNSEFSTVTIGRTITKGYTYSDLPDGNATYQQDVANRNAQKLLKQNQSVIQRVTMRNAYAPISVTDSVSLNFPTGEVNGKFEIRTQTLTLSAGCPTSTELRRYTR